MRPNRPDWRARQSRVGLALGVVLLLSAVWIASAQAQVQGDQWSQPYRLSSGAGKSSEGNCVADQYGYVHCFWTETLDSDQSTIIQYARFDGTSWTTPNSIYVTGHEIENVSPVVDQQGTLHIAWSESYRGPVYYTHAPANDAISARSWARPIRISIPASTLRLRIDAHGVLHMLYINQVLNPGVFYVRSADQGATWTPPVWLDPDILPNHVPDSLNFELDDKGGLHAVWVYGALDQDVQPDRVRYAHSLDGGHTWSAPFLIDQVDAEASHFLAAAAPRMIVQGQTVHVLWAAGDQSYRYHRYSTDAGQTWTTPQRLFGTLNGQAGDGLAIDGAGRVHYFAQIRYPQGIYHMIWDGTQWSQPSLIYLILLGEDPNEVMGDRIHAHDTLPVVRDGNQLVLTFADGPADPHRQLYEMHSLLNDVAPQATVPAPLASATAAPLPTPSANPPTSAPTPTIRPVLASGQPTTTVPGSNEYLRAAMLPTLLLLAVAVGVQLVLKYKR
jgi:hypothetical protein